MGEAPYAKVLVQKCQVNTTNVVDWTVWTACQKVKGRPPLRPSGC